jgi:hypothetical protein
MRQLTDQQLEKLADLATIATNIAPHLDAITPFVDDAKLIFENRKQLGAAAKYIKRRAKNIFKRKNTAQAAKPNRIIPAPLN